MGTKTDFLSVPITLDLGGDKVLPYMRNWLTLYGEGYTDDEFSPIAYVDVSAWRAGLYLSRFPRVSRLDLRVEAVGDGRVP